MRSGRGEDEGEEAKWHVRGEEQLLAGEVRVAVRPQGDYVSESQRRGEAFVGRQR